MEELNEICEILMEKCACSWVRDQTNEAHDKYSALKTQIQGKLFLMLIESFTPTPLPRIKLLNFSCYYSLLILNYILPGILSTMNKNIMDQNEYVTYKIEAVKWLDNANKIIEKCNNIRNLDDINSNLNEINVSTRFLVFC